MKNLHFLYKMQLELTNPIVEHAFVLRFVPQDHCFQKIKLEHVKISPFCQVAQQRDGFGNRMDVGEIKTPHQYFYYEAAGVAMVDHTLYEAEKGNPVFRYDTPLTRRDRNLEEFYNNIRPSENDDFSRGVCVMHRLSEYFNYVSGSTSVRTTAAEAFRSKKGVCQDYAHIFLTLCRMAGIPARYVAGMMLGEGASHAWVEIYANGKWIALDPTNDQLVDDNYIKISHGRDGSDCAVERGTFKGNTLQNQNVYVKVEEI